MDGPTRSPSPSEIERKVLQVDAAGQKLGRIASAVARLLIGKHKVLYTPHSDVGDFVVIVNCEKVILTGRKPDSKTYFRYTGFPGGAREQTVKELLERHPDRVLRKAIRGMLPKNKLGRKMLGRLRIYAGPEHPHQAQIPIKADIVDQEILPLELYKKELLERLSDLVKGHDMLEPHSPVFTWGAKQYSIEELHAALRRNDSHIAGLVESFYIFEQMKARRK